MEVLCNPFHFPLPRGMARRWRKTHHLRPFQSYEPSRDYSGGLLQFLGRWGASWMCQMRDHLMRWIDIHTAGWGHFWLWNPLPTSDLQEQDSFWVPVEFASTFYGIVKVEQFRHLYCAANLRDFGYTVLTDTQVSWKRVAVLAFAAVGARRAAAWWSSHPLKRRKHLVEPKLFPQPPEWLILLVGEFPFLASSHPNCWCGEALPSIICQHSVDEYLPNICTFFQAKSSWSSEQLLHLPWHVLWGLLVRSPTLRAVLPGFWTFFWITKWWVSQISEKMNTSLTDGLSRNVWSLSGVGSLETKWPVSLDPDSPVWGWKDSRQVVHGSSCRGGAILGR